MSKRVMVFGVVLLLAFVGITVLRWIDASEPIDPPETVVSDTARQTTAAFWEVYRQATDHRMAGRQREAAAAYERALTLDPDHQDALYYSGNMYVELQRYDEARSKWEHLVAVNPSSARGHARLGDLYFCLGDVYVVDLEEANAAYQMAHEINREETGHLLRLGEVALALGDMEAARARFGDVLVSDPGNADVPFFLAYLDRLEGKGALAVDRLESAQAEVAPEVPEGMTGEGDTRTSERQFERAGCPDLQSIVSGFESAGRDHLLREAERRFTELDEWLQRRQITPKQPVAAAIRAPARPQGGS